MNDVQGPFTTKIFTETDLLTQNWHQYLNFDYLICFLALFATFFATFICYLCFATFVLLALVATFVHFNLDVFHVKLYKCIFILYVPLLDPLLMRISVNASFSSALYGNLLYI